jgi:hypothetical protein
MKPRLLPEIIITEEMGEEEINAAVIGSLNKFLDKHGAADAKTAKEIRDYISNLLPLDRQLHIFKHSCLANLETTPKSPRSSGIFARPESPKEHDDTGVSYCITKRTNRF